MISFQARPKKARRERAFSFALQLSGEHGFGPYEYGYGMRLILAPKITILYQMLILSESRPGSPRCALIWPIGNRRSGRTVLVTPGMLARRAAARPRLSRSG